MKKVSVFFTKSNSIWSKLINFFYKTFFNKETKFTHCGFLFSGKVFEIDISKESGFYDVKLNNPTIIEFDDIPLDKFNKLISKYKGLKYDLSEIFTLLKDKSSPIKDEKFICSTLVAYMLKDLGYLDNYNYETINPDDVFELIKNKE